MLKRAYLDSLNYENQRKAIFQEIIKCKISCIHTIESYCTIPDAVTGEDIPLKFYPYQVTAINDFDDYSYNLSMKSRQMGFTTITAAYCAWDGATKNNRVINVLANKMLVSKKNLKTIRSMLDTMRQNTLYKCAKTGKVKSWLIADYEEGINGKEQFQLRTGSVYTAEANNESAGRGGTIHIYWIDEVAAIDQNSANRMEEIWASAGIALTRSKGKCIGISTPRGSSGWYFDQYTNAEKNSWNIIKAHWLEHPEYSKGAYKWIIDETLPEKGYLKFLNSDWPIGHDKTTREFYKTKETYTFILDGRTRSPWYDSESKRLGVQKTLCELDCSFAGSGGEVLSPERIKELDIEATKKKLINKPDKGIWKSYKQYKEYNPEHEYAVSVDVMTGDGEDFSSVVVIDITEKCLAASWKDQYDPIVLAEISCKIAYRFGKPKLIVEYQGPGLTVLLELKNKWLYKNLYYSILKKQDITKVAKKKIGFWQSNDTRRLGGDKLEELLNNPEKGWDLAVPDLVNELYTWIWDKDGKRRHAPGKHDDFIMALQNALFYIFHVKDRQSVGRNTFRETVEKMSSGWGVNENRRQDDLDEMFADIYD